jgi:hypothetical protein
MRRSAEDEVQDDQHDSRDTQEPTDEILTHDHFLSKAFVDGFILLLHAGHVR